MATELSETFHLVLIKPSHYDDDGYPIQWVRSLIPSNTLAAVNGLAEDGYALLQATQLYWKIKRDPERYAYTDLAITPPMTDELETLSLYQDTSGGSNAVDRKHAADRLREKFNKKSPR